MWVAMIISASQKDQIQRQLETILFSPDFQASERLRAFLRFIVEETLAGRDAELKAYTIGLAVFDRPDNFDPQADPVVRDQAAKLRSRLLEYYSANREPGEVRIIVPKGRYVPSFEFTNETHAPQPVAIPSTSPEAQMVASAQLLRPSVAVMDIADLSGKTEHSMFAKGLAENLILGLARFPDIITVNLNYEQEGGGEDFFDFAAGQGVRFVLHGSIQIVAEMLRVYVKFSDTLTRSNLWVEKFDRKVVPEDLFKTQDEIAQAVVAQVADGFGMIRRTLMTELPSGNSDEYQVYEASLLYHNWTFSFQTDRFFLAKKALERVLVVEPDNEFILSMLADIYATDYQLGYTDEAGQYLDKSLVLANKAVFINPNCQTARMILALNYFLRRDQAQFMASVSSIVALNPSDSYILGSVGSFHVLMGNTELGLPMIEKAMEMNPRAPSWFYEATFMHHYLLEEYEQALVEVLRITIPRSPVAAALRTCAYAKLGRNKQAAECLDEFLEIMPKFRKDPERFLYAWVYSDENVRALEDGLRLAGF